MSYFEAGPLDVADARAWAAYHGKLVVDLVRHMESRQSFDSVSIDGFLTVSDRLRNGISEQAAAAAVRGERTFTARIPMTAQEYRMFDTMAELMTNYAEILELRGIPYPMPPDDARRVIDTFAAARLVD